jgi:hypothetical protein
MMTTEQALAAASALLGGASWLYKRQAAREERIDKRLRRLELAMVRIEERLADLMGSPRESLVSASDAPESDA